METARRTVHELNATDYKIVDGNNMDHLHAIAGIIEIRRMQRLVELGYPFHHSISKRLVSTLNFPTFILNDRTILTDSKTLINLPPNPAACSGMLPRALRTTSEGDEVKLLRW